MTTIIKNPGMDAYNQVKKLEMDITKGATSTPNSVTDTKAAFVNYLEDVVQTSKQSDFVAAKAIDGKASSLEVMRATTAAETKIAEFMQVWNRLTQVIQDLERKNV